MAITTTTKNKLEALLRYNDGGFTNSWGVAHHYAEKTLGSENGIELFTVDPTIEALRNPWDGICYAVAIELTEVEVLMPTGLFYDEEDETETDPDVLIEWATNAIEEALGVRAKIVSDWEPRRYYEQGATFELLTPVRHECEDYEVYVADMTRAVLEATRGCYTKEEARAYAFM